MTVSTARKPLALVASNKPAPAFAKGKGADARNLAFGDVSTFAYIEGKSRAETVATLQRALGKSPTPAQLDACRVAYIIGRVAGKLQIGDGAVAQIDAARDIVLHYASPVKDGVAARKLRKGQKGRRTIEQHKAVRAAEEAWSQMKAEVAPAQSTAKTQGERNKAKRAPAMKGSTLRGAAAGAGVTHSELVKPDGKPMDRAAATDYVASMAATLLMFANKHAAVLPTDMGTAIKAFHKAATASHVEAKRTDGGEA